MAGSDDPILNAFLRAWNQDHERGEDRPIEAYVARWPAHEPLLRRTHARLTREGGGADAGETGGPAPRHTGALSDVLARELPFVRAYVRLRAGARLRRLESDSDLVQSICREALEGIDDRGVGPFRAWLCTLALRKLIEKDRYHAAACRDDQRRDTGRGSSFETDDAALRGAYSRIGSPSEVAMARETAEVVERAMDTLSDEDREVVLLSRLVGLSTPEIADQQCRSEGAVRVALSRALARIARALGNRADGRDSR